MRVAAACVCFLLAALVTAGENQGTLEGIVKGMLAGMERITTTLMTIQDEDSAKAARTALQKEALNWRELVKKAEKVPPPNKEEKERLAKTYRPKLEESQRNLFGEIARVQTVPGGKEALLEVSKALAARSSK